MRSLNDCTNLLECAFYWEKNDPDRVYMTQPMGGGASDIKTWTWKEAMNDARCMAAYLKSLDLPEKSRIAICSKNCAWWIMADLAIWMAGHVSVPVYPILTSEIVRYTLDHSEAQLLFVGKLDPVWDEMKKGVPKELPTIDLPLAPESRNQKWDDIVASHAPMDTPELRSPDEMATIIYTSGTTGLPKGVMISFKNMFEAAKAISTHLSSDKNDRFLSYLPLAHAYERLGVESQSLYSGLSIWFADALDTFLEDLRRASPTIFLSVPRLWAKFQLGVFEKLPPRKLDFMLKIPFLKQIVKKKILKNLGLDRVRVAISGSAPISESILGWYRELGLELLEAYGMTENFAYSHFSSPGKSRLGYVGSPVHGVVHKISPDGEVLVKSPGDMMGYYKNAEATNDTFTKDGFLRTGDRGEIDDQNRLKITGRLKELFKTSKGKYVAPAPIENEITNNYRVEACLVSGAGYPQPHVVVMLSPDASEFYKNGGKQTLEQEFSELLESVNSKLPQHEKLSFIAVSKDEWLTENGFLTPTMKVKRARIEEVYGAMSEQWYASRQKVVWQE